MFTDYIGVVKNSKNQRSEYFHRMQPSPQQKLQSFTVELMIYAVTLRNERPMRYIALSSVTVVVGLPDRSSSSSAVLMLLQRPYRWECCMDSIAFVAVSLLNVAGFPCWIYILGHEYSIHVITKAQYS